MSSDDDWAGTFEPLRRAAEEHRADTAAIRRRVAAAVDRAPARPVHRLPWAVAAGTALVILAVGQLVADPFGLTTTRPPAATPGATAASSATSTATGTGPTPAASGTGAPTPSRGTGTTAPSAGIGGPASSTVPAPAPSSPPATRPAGGVPHRWTALPPGGARSVTLPGPGTLDWVFPGARADLVLQRAKRPAAGQALAVELPDQAVSEPGPLLVTYRDAVPEQEHADVDRWLVAPTNGALALQVPPSGAARTLRLYLGGAGLRGILELAGPGSTVTEQVTGPAGSGPWLLTVDLPAGRALTVSLSGGPGPGGIAVGPVVLAG